MADEEPVKYDVKDRVQIYTGNADGTIPGEEDCFGTVEGIINDAQVLVFFDDGREAPVSVDRLTKLPDEPKRKGSGDCCTV